MQFNFAPRPISGDVLPKINAVEEGQFFNWNNHGERQLYLASVGTWVRIQIGDTLRLDDLYVKNLYAETFYFRQTNASNGDDMVTDTAEVEGVEGVTVYFKDASGYNLCPFKVNDLITAKRITMDKSLTISYVKATVTSVSGRGVQVIYYSDATFKKGDTVVRVGNTTDTTRQDSILLSTNDTYSPYMDIYNGISTWSGTGTNSWDYKVPMVSIGNLKKINATYGHGVYIGAGGQFIIEPSASVVGLGPFLPATNVTLYSTTAPTTRADGSALVVGDMWYDSDDNNHQYRWNGTTWLDIKDWSANWNYLINKPSYVGTPSGSGLFIDATHMGYYSGGAWQTYIDNTGKYYFTGDANNYISWNGTTQTVKGNIIITGGSGIGTLSDANLDNIGNGSTYYRTTANQVTGAGRAYTALNANNNLITSVIPASAITPSGAGLYLGSNYLGYYNGGSWQTYMDNAGNFYLGGTSGKLQWNGTTLSINGNITISGGSGIANLTDANQDNIADGATYKRVTSTEKTGAGRAYTGLDASNRLITAVIPATSITPSGAGLYLGSNYMGYYSGTAWKTYMDNTGILACSGTSASLTWNPTTDTLSVIGGTITGGTVQNSTDANTHVIINTTGLTIGATTFTTSYTGGANPYYLTTQNLGYTTSVNSIDYKITGNGNDIIKFGLPSLGGTPSLRFPLGFYVGASSSSPSIDASGAFSGTGLAVGGLFVVNSFGQLTKINNISPTAKYTLIGDGTSFSPRLLAMSDLPAQTANRVLLSDASGYVTSSTVTNTTLGYLDATSSIQTQLNGKQATITGAATTITSSNLTASRVITSDASGKVAVSSVASSELFTPAYGELYDAVATSTITCNGTNYVKWTGSTVGNYKGVTGNTTSDDLTIGTGSDGKYLVTWSVSFKANTTGDYYWTVNVTGSPDAKSKKRINVGTANIDYTVNGQAIITLIETDTVNLGCYGSNGNIVTVSFANLSITKLSN